MRTKGGRKKDLTNLQVRRKVWDNLDSTRQKGTKRPGSSSRKKQA